MSTDRRPRPPNDLLPKADMEAIQGHLKAALPHIILALSAAAQPDADRCPYRPYCYVRDVHEELTTLVRNMDRWLATRGP
jgi:hypothetical protein